VLSIDSRLQYVTYKALKEGVALTHAKSGAATVLDARTGEVLAMVSQPSWNPNNRTSRNEDGLVNRPMVDLMEPGSTAKTFTITAALESGKFDVNSVIDTSPYIINGHRLTDPVNYGPSTMARIIAKSSNVGASKIGLEIGYQPIVDVLKRVGYGALIGTGFPGEVGGSVPIHPDWGRSYTASLSYGYGFQVSQLQMAQAYSIMANRGIRKPVSLLKVNGPVEGTRVIDEKVASDVVEMLRGVVEKGGTSVKANIPSYHVAGKSGTTWLHVQSQGYDKSNFIAHFAGMAPVDNPRVVIVVSIKQPTVGVGGAHAGGGTVSAPVFAQIASAAMRIFEVPPEAPFKTLPLPNHQQVPVEPEPEPDESEPPEILTGPDLVTAAGSGARP
jgi:cell division protein FtsI (penicillin-binding protein 3)